MAFYEDWETLLEEAALFFVASYDKPHFPTNPNGLSTLNRTATQNECRALLFGFISSKKDVLIGRLLSVDAGKLRHLIQRSQPCFSKTCPCFVLLNRSP